MYFRVNGERYPDQSYFLTQDLIFDPAILTHRPQNLVHVTVVEEAPNKEFPIDEFSFQLLKRRKSSPNFRTSQNISSFFRTIDDPVPFEGSLFYMIDNVCLDNGVFLFPSDIDLTWSPYSRRTVFVPMFARDRNIYQTLNQRLIGLQAERDALECEEEINAKDGEIQTLRNRIDRTPEGTLALARTRLEDLKEAEGDNYKEIAFVYSMIDWYEDIIKINAISRHRPRARAIRRIREDNLREMAYKMILSDGRGLFSTQLITKDYTTGDAIYMMPIGKWFDWDRFPTLIATFLFGLLVFVMVGQAKKGRDLYIRPIAGIEEIDNAIGRATEMGRPILFSPGLDGIGVVATLAGLSILSRVAKKAAEYDTPIIVPNRDAIVLPIAQEIVREAHAEAGRPDSFDKNSVFFMADQQFAYVAGVNGIMVRQKTATNFYMGAFYAESLIMTETGNATGAIQIAGTDSVTQIPFFITTCDYTLMGEELYAASAYMARQPIMLGTLKAQDYYKFLILAFLIFGTLLATLEWTAIIDAFPRM
jgi:hypothetical protein